MAGGQKTINRKFVLYSEQLLDDYRVLRVFILILHILSLLLGMTAFIIGIFAHVPGPGGPSDSLAFVNCSLTPPIQLGVHFPVHLMLLLTGLGLVAVDISASLLLYAIKCISCGVLVIIWFLGTTLCVTVWTIWSIVYIAMVFPIWLQDRQTCDNLIMISTTVGTAVMTLLMTVYGLLIIVVIAYDCWYRCTCDCYKKDTSNPF